MEGIQLSRELNFTDSSVGNMRQIEGRSSRRIVLGYMFRNICGAGMELDVSWEKLELRITGGWFPPSTS